MTNDIKKDGHTVTIPKGEYRLEYIPGDPPRFRITPAEFSSEGKLLTVDDDGKLRWNTDEVGVQGKYSDLPTIELDAPTLEQFDDMKVRIQHLSEKINHIQWEIGSTLNLDVNGTLRRRIERLELALDGKA